MHPGEIAEIILRDGEPLRNVPAAVRDLGYLVLSVEETGRAGIHRMLVKAGTPAVT